MSRRINGIKIGDLVRVMGNSHGAGYAQPGALAIVVSIDSRSTSRRAVNVQFLVRDSSPLYAGGYPFYFDSAWKGLDGDKLEIVDDTEI